MNAAPAIHGLLSGVTSNQPEPNPYLAGLGGLLGSFTPQAQNWQQMQGAGLAMQGRALSALQGSLSPDQLASLQQQWHALTATSPIPGPAVSWAKPQLPKFAPLPQMSSVSPVPFRIGASIHSPAEE